MYFTRRSLYSFSDVKALPKKVISLTNRFHTKRRSKPQRVFSTWSLFGTVSEKMIYRCIVIAMGHFQLDISFPRKLSHL